MRGLGKYSKRGSGFIIAGVSGGAVVPPALGAAADASSTATAMAVPMAFFVLAWSYSLAVNFVPAYREPIDMAKDSTLAVPDLEEKFSGEEELEKGGVVRAEHARGAEEITKA